MSDDFTAGTAGILFRATPGDTPMHLRVRALLKHALRVHGLRCVQLVDRIPETVAPARRPRTPKGRLAPAGSLWEHAMSTAAVVAGVRELIGRHHGDDGELYAALCEEAERWRKVREDLERMETALELNLDPEDVPTF